MVYEEGGTVNEIKYEVVMYMLEQFKRASRTQNTKNESVGLEN